MLSLRSFFGFTLSLLAHGSVGAYILTHDFKPEKPKPKEIVMQMAMFKVAPAPVVIAKPIVIPPPPKAIEKPVTVTPPKEPIIEKVEVVKEPTPPVIVETPKPEPKPVEVIKKVAIVKPLVKPPIKVKPKTKKKVIKKKPKLKKKRIVKRKKVVVKKKPKVKPKRKIVKRKKVVSKPRRVQTPKHKKAVAKRVVRRPQKKPRRVAVKQQHGRPKQARKPVKRATVVARAKPAHRPQTASNPHLERQYEKSIRQRIEQKKVYPRRAKRMRKQGVVKVAFTISKNGSVSKLRIVRSSGVKSLDKAALQAVKKVGRFPPIPASIRKQFISYVIPISYRIR